MTCDMMLYNRWLNTGRICRETANYRHYSDNENQHYRPTGATRCTDSREIWQDRAARGCACPKISRQSVHGDGYAAPNFKFSIFW